MTKYFTTLILCLTASAAVAGAWGTGVFENDDALDYVLELTEGSPVESVSAPFRYAWHSGGYIDAYVGARVLVAAEIYAAMLGSPSDDFPAELKEWLGGKTKRWGNDIKGRETTIMTVKSLLDPEKSELAALWSESPVDFELWAETVNDVARRLEGPSE